MPRLGHPKFGLYNLGLLRRRSFVDGTLQYFEVDFHHVSQMKAKHFVHKCHMPAAIIGSLNKVSFFPVEGWMLGAMLQPDMRPDHWMRRRRERR